MKNNKEQINHQNPEKKTQRSQKNLKNKGSLTLKNTIRLKTGTADGGTVLQIVRSLVRFQMVSLEFFIDIILPIGPGVDSPSNRNEYQEHFLGVTAAGA
jgi:hypothetical protein